MAGNNRAADFTNTAVATAALNLNSAAPGFSDFFEQFFGGGRGQSAFGGGGFGRRPASAERGSDVEADIMVPLEEALNGAKRTVSFRRGGSKKTETYQVKIPQGVREGQRIRLAGQGEAGAGGGKSGDLFLRVRLARHPDFTVEGSDLIHEVKIAPWQAVLGAEIKVDSRRKCADEDSAGHTRLASVFVCAGAGCHRRQELAAIFLSRRKFKSRKK